MTWNPFPCSKSAFCCKSSAFLNVWAWANYVIYLLWAFLSPLIFKLKFLPVQTMMRKICKCTCMYTCVCLNAPLTHTWKSASCSQSCQQQDAWKGGPWKPWLGWNSPKLSHYPCKAQAHDGQREATSSICVVGTHAMQAAFIKGS